jgi:hypothetical protein
VGRVSILNSSERRWQNVRWRLWGFPQQLLRDSICRTCIHVAHTVRTSGLLPRSTSTTFFPLRLIGIWCYPSYPKHIERLLLPTLVKSSIYNSLIHPVEHMSNYILPRLHTRHEDLRQLIVFGLIDGFGWLGGSDVSWSLLPPHVSFSIRSLLSFPDPEIHSLCQVL